MTRYYWAKYEGTWLPAKSDDDKYYKIIGWNQAIHKRLFDAIGPEIARPEGLRDD